MTNQQLLAKIKKLRPYKIGKVPLVVLPLDYFEKMKEDLEMLYSKKLPGEIEKARREVRKGNVLTLNEVKKRLKL